MAEADGSIIIDTKIDRSGLDDLEKDVNKVSKNLKNTLGNGLKTAFSGAQKAASAFGKAAKTVASGVAKAFEVTTKAVAAVGTALGAVATAGIKYNAEIEQYQTAFETMTGSAEEAAQVVEQLRDIGASTPFELPDLAETTQLLMNYGFEAQEAIDSMQMLGDISQGSADKMQRVATAYGQMSSAGKVSLEDIKQMIDAGFNPLQEISESTGESMSSLYDRISKGTISVDEITASMERATSEGGKYFQSMQKQSQTFSGQLSTLKDNANEFMGAITQGIFQSLSTGLLPQAISAVQQLQTAFETGGATAAISLAGSIIGNFITQMTAKIPEVIPIVVQLLSTFTQAITDNAGTLVNAAMAILTGLGEAFTTLAPMVATLVLTFLTQFALYIQENQQMIIDALVNTVMGFSTWIQENADTIATIVTTLFTALADAAIEFAPILLDVALQLLEELGNYLAENASMIGEKIGDFIAAMLQWVIDNWDKIWEVGTEIVKAIIEAIGSMISKVVAVFKELIENCMAEVREWASEIWSTITQAWQSVIDWIDGIFSGEWMDGIGALAEPLRGLLSGLKEIWEGIKEVFSGVIDFIAGVFTGDWERAWEGVRSVFEGIWDALVGIVKTPINAIIGLINGVIRGINSISIDIPDWVPLFGGSHIGFSIPTIPLLAQGAVIPPNAPFMAVLGDQRNGTNIEAPLDTIKQAMREVMGEGGGDGTYIIRLYLSGRQIYEEVLKQNQLNSMATGVNAMAGG